MDLKNDTRTQNKQKLINKNEEFKNRFSNNLLFKMMRAGDLTSTEQKEKFLGFFQIWSNHFHKAMLIKTAFCDDATFTPVFKKHFHEELGHDQMLTNDRKAIFNKRDAVLEGVSSWFPFKMLSFSIPEQIIVMNLVVEGSAIVFYEHARPVLDSNNKMKHFQVHQEDLDTSHEQLGLDLLDVSNETQFKRLQDVQEESWAMIEAVMNRLGELCSQNQ